MNCYDLEQILSDYIDNTLSPTQRIEAEKHLAECKECQNKLECMKDVVNCVRNMPKICACNEFEARLLERIEKEKKKKQRPVMTILQDYSRAISLSAAAILLVAASVFVYSSLSVNGAAATAPTANVRAMAPASQLPANISNSTQAAYSRVANQTKANVDTSKKVIPDNNNRIMMVNE